MKGSKNDDGEDWIKMSACKTIIIIILFLENIFGISVFFYPHRMQQN